MFDLFREFVQLTQALDSAGVAYAVCGGVALAVHGLPRATKDIDLLIPAEQLDATRAAARTLGFTLESGRMTFSASGVEIQRLTKVASGDHLMIDLMLVNEATRSAWESRHSVAFEDGRVSVVSREGLVGLKKKAGRPQDLADIARLEAGE